MRVECPICTVAYEVPQSLLTVQRRLRCAGCGHEWWMQEPTPEALPDVAPEPTAPLAAPLVAEIHEPAASREPSSRLSIDPPATPRMDRMIWAGWAASIALLLLAVWAGEHYRHGIMRIWPPSERLFAAIGQGPSGKGPNQQP
jgi:predicted Zn finger-like uncharacterized protein